MHCVLAGCRAGSESGRPRPLFLFLGSSKQTDAGDRSSAAIADGRGAGAHEDEEVYRDIPSELRALIEPVVADHACELVDAEVHRGRPGVLRIVVDSASADGRVPVDALARLSREIEAQLDVSDWMTGSYRLELTSPGLDRVLGREKDFAAAARARSVVKLQTRRPIDGRRRYRGVLIGFEDATARIEVDGTVFAVPFDEIEKANTVYEFTSADFKGRAQSSENS